MRRTLPAAITLITGLIVILKDIFISPAFNKLVQDYLVRSVTLSTATAVALGGISLIRVHSRRVARKREGWYNSIILIFGFFLLMILGVFLEGGHNSATYQWFYQNTAVAGSSTVFSLLCFYIGSAAYRAFRARSMEAGALLISASLVMLGSTSIGAAISPMLPKAKVWIMDYFNTPTIRGVALGVALGAFAQGARNLFGIERGYMAE
jgi:cytochrome bd-type quinol oxidase subunit 2